MSPFILVAKMSQLREDAGLTVEVRGRYIALFLFQNQVHAIDDLCPHMGASLGAGAVENGIVSCPWHGWRFRVTDGAWVSCPNNKNKVYNVKVEGEDILLDLNW